MVRCIYASTRTTHCICTVARQRTSETTTNKMTEIIVATQQTTENFCNFMLVGIFILLTAYPFLLR